LMLLLLLALLPLFLSSSESSKSLGPITTTCLERSDSIRTWSFHDLRLRNRFFILIELVCWDRSDDQCNSSGCEDSASNRLVPSPEYGARKRNFQATPRDSTWRRMAPTSPVIKSLKEKPLYILKIEHLNWIYYFGEINTYDDWEWSFHDVRLLLPDWR
jgi:hypothetical protein